MSNLEIRLVAMDDFDRFAEAFGDFELKSHVGTPDPVKILKEEFDQEPTYQFVALKDKEIAGFISCSGHPGEALYIRHLMVSDAAHGNGVSRQLIEAVDAATGSREIHIWTSSGRYPCFADLLGFEVLEAETRTRYVQRIDEMDLTPQELPKGWLIRRIEREDIGPGAELLIQEGYAEDLADLAGEPSSEVSGEGYLLMAFEEFRDLFYVCATPRGLQGLVFGGLGLDLVKEGEYGHCAVGKCRSWLQWLVASQELSQTTRRECLRALLVELVRTVGKMGALWFEALVDQEDDDQKAVMELMGLEAMDQYRALHLVKGND